MFGYAQGINPGMFGYRKRGSLFAPTDIDGLALWLDASDESTITASSGAVSQWDDKSGNGNHVTQGVAADQPSTGTRTLNGRNVIEYLGGGVSTWLGGVNPTQNVAATWFFVFQNDGAAFYGQFKTGNGYAFIAQSGSSSTAINSEVGTPGLRVNGAAQSPTTRGEVYTAFGTSPVIITMTSLTANSVNYKTTYDSDSLPTDGIHGEIIAYPSELSAGNIEQVEAYLADKWGVTLS